uniref:Alternative protein RAE1 n=1 Tax=Homo sapiens TaxID=9606 RepID=L0R530_HUMAN|nr:alternative protein RAE1 [Homo sapiens]
MIALVVCLLAHQPCRGTFLLQDHGLMMFAAGKFKTVDRPFQKPSRCTLGLCLMSAGVTMGAKCLRHRVIKLPKCGTSAVTKRYRSHSMMLLLKPSIGSKLQTTAV